LKLLKNVIIAAICLAAIAFGLKNHETVTVKYYLHDESIDIPLYLLLFISVFIGMMIGGIEGFFEKMKGRKTIKKIKKELYQKEKELTSLRNLPITESKVQPKNLESEGTFSNEG